MEYDVVIVGAGPAGSLAPPWGGGWARSFHILVYISDVPAAPGMRRPISAWRHLGHGLVRSVEEARMAGRAGRPIDL